MQIRGTSGNGVSAEADFFVREVTVPYAAGRSGMYIHCMPVSRVICGGQEKVSPMQISLDLRKTWTDTPTMTGGKMSQSVMDALADGEQFLRNVFGLPGLDLLDIYGPNTVRAMLCDCEACATGLAAHFAKYVAHGAFQAVPALRGE